MQQDSLWGCSSGNQPIYYESHLSTVMQSTDFLRCSMDTETVNYKGNPGRDIRSFPEKETAALSTSPTYLKWIDTFFLLASNLKERWFKYKIQTWDWNHSPLFNLDMKLKVHLIRFLKLCKIKLWSRSRNELNTQLSPEELFFFLHIHPDRINW